MEQEIARPITVLQCHPKWFEKEVEQKGRNYTQTSVDPVQFRVAGWDQNRIQLNRSLPPEGFYAT